MDAVKAILGVQVLGCHFHYAQCMNRRAKTLLLGKARKESATPRRTPVVDLQTERALDEFMVYYRTTWLPPIGQFSLPCDHSQNQHLTLTGTLFPDEIQKFCAAKLTMAKTLAILFSNGLLKDRYI
uniref:MULE domain-containing protein n=1 Tax=Heterorhabditis bacteriophora TaxID=37862 RepID=A0A1I7XHD1_HETBA